MFSNLCWCSDKKKGVIEEDVREKNTVLSNVIKFFICLKLCKRKDICCSINERRTYQAGIGPSVNNARPLFHEPAEKGNNMGNVHMDIFPPPKYSIVMIINSLPIASGPKQLLAGDLFCSSSSRSSKDLSLRPENWPNWLWRARYH